MQTSLLRLCAASVLLAGCVGRKASAKNIRSAVSKGYSWCEENRKCTENGSCLPCIIGISCVNCGSTALASYLVAHPQVSWGQKKEHLWLQSGINKASDWEKYAMQFEVATDTIVAGLDYSPSYVQMGAGPAQLAKEVVPWARITGINRSPVEEILGRIIGAIQLGETQPRGLGAGTTGTVGDARMSECAQQTSCTHS